MPYLRFRYAKYSQSNGQSGGGNSQNQQQNVADEDEGYDAANEDANEDDAANESGYADADEDQNGRRKLWQGQYQPVKCDTCEKFRCFDSMQNQDDNGRNLDEEDEYAVDLESIVGWFDKVAVCQDTGALLDGQWPLYSSFMCNEDGSGVEIGLFLDGDCAIYTSRESFQNVASAYNQAYMYEAADIITYPFRNSISCNNEYLSREDYKEMQQNNNNNQNNEDYGEASEFCSALFDGDDQEYGALSLRDCDGDGQENAQEENAKVTEYYSYDYYWYTFVLTYEASLNPATTCSLLQTMQGEYTHVYSWKRSGQLYNYGSTSSRWDASAVRDYFADYNKMDGVLVAAIVLGVVFALFSLFCILYSCCCQSSAPNKYLKRIDEDKKRSGLLMDERTGAVLM
jgi:hypothetical protein